MKQRGHTGDIRPARWLCNQDAATKPRRRPSCGWAAHTF